MWEGRELMTRQFQPKSFFETDSLDSSSFFLSFFGGGLVKLKDYIHTVCLREKKFKLEEFFHVYIMPHKKQNNTGVNMGDWCIYNLCLCRPVLLGISIPIQLDGVYLNQKWNQLGSPIRSKKSLYMLKMAFYMYPHTREGRENLYLTSSHSPLSQ